MKKILGIIVLTSLPMLCMADIVVVTHPDNSIDKLDKKSLIDIYMGRAKTFGNSVLAHPIDQNQESAMRAVFYQEITGKRLAQVNAYWARLKFTGRHQPPLDDFESDDQILSYVEITPGAIAYIDSANLNDKVKVVHTIKVK